MRTSLLHTVAAIVLAFAVGALASTAASAKGPGGGGGPPHGFSQGNKVGWNNGKVPPGWSHGHKVGWNGIRTMPPGWR